MTFRLGSPDTSLTMDRRRFLEGSTALGVAGALGTMSGPAMAAEPKKGGRLRVALAEGSTSDTLDPQTYTDIYMISVGFATHSTLTEISPEGDLVGDAAESWEGSDDASAWTFRIREGVTFSDGKKLTAEDVIASIQHHRGEDSKSAAKDLVTPIAEMTKVDDRTVTFVLDGPNADFPYLMADYHLLMMPATEGGKVDWENYIGTGGYVLESFEPGVRTVMKRRPDYWKEGRAHFDELELLYVADVVARQNAVATGEVDMMSRVDLKTVGLLKRRPGLRVEEATGFLHYTAPMLTQSAPYDNVELRRAIKYSLDREELVSKILRGHGALGNDHPIAPSVPFHNATLPQRVQDLDKAKFHLKKAGYSGEELVLSAADAAYAGAVDASILMQEQLAKAGINMRVDRVPNDGYWSNIWLKKPWCACYWGGRPTCDWMFTQAYASGASWNDTQFEHERFNMLLNAGRAETDPLKRAEIYGEMQQIVSDDGGAVVWGFANYVYAMADKVQHGPDVAANWALDGGRYVERWWFA
ncbi:MAG: ABC transporter substrate-binding protein [Pseudomonadota bacterium]